MNDGMRKPPFERHGVSEGFRGVKRLGPFRLWITRYRNWTNYYGSTFSHAQLWLGDFVEFDVDYYHYRWPEFQRDRKVSIRWTFPVLRYLTGEVTHEWSMRPPLERR